MSKMGLKVIGKGLKIFRKEKGALNLYVLILYMLTNIGVRVVAKLCMGVY